MIPKQFQCFTALKWVCSPGSTLQLAGLAGPGCVAGRAGRDTGLWRRMEKRGRVKT